MHLHTRLMISVSAIIINDMTSVTPHDQGLHVALTNTASYLEPTLIMINKTFHSHCKQSHLADYCGIIVLEKRLIPVFQWDIRPEPTASGSVCDCCMEDHTFINRTASIPLKT